MTVDDVIYLDYNASTPVDPRVLEGMLPFFATTFANPASRSHRPGRAAYRAQEEARALLADIVGAAAGSDVVFTSGATEANNLGLLGAAAAEPGRRHLVTQISEHPSVLAPLHHLTASGWRLTVVGVDRRGVVDLGQLAEAVTGDTAVVSIMLANNETGTVQPVRAVADLAHRVGAVVHCDAAQALGKIPVDVAELGVDSLALSAHKVYGPKGVGALVLGRGRRRPLPRSFGGDHESGLRPGTGNLPGMVGLAHAAALAADLLDDEAPRLAGLRDRLEERVLAGLGEVTVNGAGSHRLPNTSNLSFAGVDGAALLASLPDLAVSTGSACSSSHTEPSSVLVAMGVAKKLAAASLRLSVGRPTTALEVERAAERLITEVTRLRLLHQRRRRP